MKNEKRFLLGVNSLRPKRKNKPVCVCVFVHAHTDGVDLGVCRSVREGRKLTSLTEGEV